MLPHLHSIEPPYKCRHKDAFFCFDTQLRLTHWDPHLESLLGGAPDGAVRGKVFEIIPGFGETHLVEVLYRVLEGEVILNERFSGELTGIADNCSLEASFFPLWDSPHNVAGGLVVIRDISEQLQIDKMSGEEGQMFRHVAENIDEVLLVFEPDNLKPLYISPAYEQIWGRPCESLYEKPSSYLDAIHPEDRKRVDLASEKHLRGELTSEIYRIIRPEGKILWIRERGLPVRDASGRVYRIVRIAEDISDKRLNECARLTLASIVESSDDAIVSITVEGLITSWNTAAAKIYGYTAEEIIGHSISTVIPSELKGELTQCLERVKSGERINQRDTVHIGKEGKHVNVSFSMSPIKDQFDQLIGVSTIARDITKVRRAENALRRLAEWLTSAQEEEHRRISRVLHDVIGQTLTALSIGMETLKSRLADGTIDATAACAEINELQAVSKSSHQFLRRLAHDLHPSILEDLGVAVALRSFLEGVAASSGVKVSVDIPSDFPRLPSASESGIYRIMQEAVSNILKHANAHKIWLRMTTMDDMALVVIQDDGCGFDQDVMTSYRGIGLINMRERAEIIGGSLDIVSCPSQGTEIRLQAPLKGVERESDVLELRLQ